MLRVLKAGTLYFALVFAAGFVLGTVRTLAVAPKLGETSAVMIEAPVMLALSWLACGWILKRIEVRSAGSRLAMGLFAFVLLGVAELGPSLLLGRTPAEHFAAYRTPAGLIGLCAQAAFAFVPLFRRTGSASV